MATEEDVTPTSQANEGLFIPSVVPALAIKIEASRAVNVLMTRPFDRRIESGGAHVRGCFPRGRRRKKRYFNQVESLIRPGQTNTDCADKNNTSRKGAAENVYFFKPPHETEARTILYPLHSSIHPSTDVKQQLSPKCPEYPSMVSSGSPIFLRGYKRRPLIVPAD